MFAMNFDNILAILTAVSSCVLAYALIMLINELFDRIDKKIEQVRTEKSKIESEINSLREENKHLKFINNSYKEKIDSLSYQLAPSFDNADEELVKTNDKLNIRCDMLEQELQKTRSIGKQNKNIKKKFNRELRNLGCYDDNYNVY